MAFPPETWGGSGSPFIGSDPRIVYVSVEQGLRYNASTAYEERAGRGVPVRRSGRDLGVHERLEPPAHVRQSDPRRSRPTTSASTWRTPSPGRTTEEEPSPRPARPLHGDDRFLWVNPNDSRHVIKADDGGLGISLRPSA